MQRAAAHFIQLQRRPSTAAVVLVLLGRSLLLRHGPNPPLRFSHRHVCNSTPPPSLPPGDMASKLTCLRSLHLKRTALAGGSDAADALLAALPRLEQLRLSEEATLPAVGFSGLGSLHRLCWEGPLAEGEAGAPAMQLPAGCWMASLERLQVGKPSRRAGYGGNAPAPLQVCSFPTAGQRTARLPLWPRGVTRAACKA